METKVAINLFPLSILFLTSWFGSSLKIVFTSIIFFLNFELLYQSLNYI